MPKVHLVDQLYDSNAKHTVHCAGVKKRKSSTCSGDDWSCSLERRCDQFSDDFSSRSRRTTSSSSSGKLLIIIIFMLKIIFLSPGVTTFLALVLLAGSTSHTFLTFFKVTLIMKIVFRMLKMIMMVGDGWPYQYCSF